MNKNMKQQLLDLIDKSGPIGPSNLADQLKISRVMVHRYLKNLLAEHKIRKIGLPPKVLYTRLKQSVIYHFPALTPDVEKYIKQHYLAVKPDGMVLEGLQGFQWWAQKTKQHKYFCALAKEYVENHQKYSQLNRNELNVIDATSKIRETFDTCYLDYVFYQSFYSLPKFGKTKTGQMITLGKSGQDMSSIEALAKVCREPIIDLIKHFKIDGVIFTPHSIPRKVSFLKEFRRLLALSYPCTTLDKIFAGKVPIAQKSLAKLADRIENANSTLFLRRENTIFRRVLVIDDAVGSGATLNAIAHKLKTQTQTQFVCGFAVTGSLKGFDVINEI